MKILNLRVDKGLTVTILSILFLAACGEPVAGAGLAPTNVTGPTGNLSAVTFIPYNSSTTITWSTAIDVDCVLSGNGTTGASGTTGKSGAFVTPRLTTNATYSLQCGEGSQSLTINVASSAVASAITAFSAGPGAGVVTVTTINTVTDGTKITISGTTHYNGIYTVANRTPTNFTIVAAFQGDDATGFWQVAGGMIYGCSTTSITGNANAINLASYNASRYSGVAPLSVFFDASGTISTVSTTPFHELEYKWEFGENQGALGALPGGANWTNGSTKDNRNVATGPVAAHVFETPGVYTVKLTAKDGTNTVENQCAQIVVQLPDVVFSGVNTICIAAASTPIAGADGCPLGAAVYQQPDYAIAINTYARTGKRVLFKHDDTFSSNTASRIGQTGPGTIGMYGNGAKPILQTTNVNNHVLQVGVVGLYNMADWRVMDLELLGISGSLGSGLYAGGGNTDQITALRLLVRNNNVGIALDTGTSEYYAAQGASQIHVPDQITIADSEIDTTTGGWGLYGVVKRWATLGNYIHDTFSHSVRVQYVGKGVFSHNTISNPSAGNHHVFTLRSVVFSTTGCGGPGSGECFPNLLPYGQAESKTHDVVVSSNHFIAGPDTLQPVTNTPSDENSWLQLFNNIIFERNLYTANTHCCWPMLLFESQYVTVRNEIINLTGAANALGIQLKQAGTQSPASDHVWMYNNTIFNNSGNTGNPPEGVRVSADTTNTTFVNNLFYSPNSAGIVSSGATPNVYSNNTTNTATSPAFAVTPPVNPIDYRISTGSYAIGAGIVVPVWSDFFMTPQTTTRSLGAIKGP